MVQYSQLTSNLGLGAGLGLQANPKNYVPEAMKAEQFQQKLGIDKENKKLADQAKATEDKEKEDKEFRKSLKMSGGLPILNKQRYDAAVNALKVYKEAKEDPSNFGRNVNNDERVAKALMEVDKKREDLDYIESAYNKFITSANDITESDDQYKEQDKELMTIIGNEDTDALKAWEVKNGYQPTGVLKLEYADHLSRTYPATAFKTLPIAASRVSADIINKTKNVTNNQTGASLYTEVWTGLDANLKKRFEAEKARDNYEPTVRKMMRPNLLGVSLSRQEAEAKLYDVFETSAKAQIKQNLESAGSGFSKSFGDDKSPLPDVEMAYYKEQFPKEVYIDYLYKKQIKDIYKGVEKAAGGNADDLKTKNAKALIRELKIAKEKKLSEGDRANIFNKYGWSVNTREKIGAEFPGKGLGFLALKRTKQNTVPQSPSLTNEYGEQDDNVQVKGVVKIITSNIDAQGKSSPIEKTYYVGEHAGADKLYPTDSNPRENEAWGVTDAKPWAYWIKQNEDNPSGMAVDIKFKTKKEQGGYAEKQVLKKFHDKTNKKTKLVFDDGTEEIINGIF